MTSKPSTYLDDADNARLNRLTMAGWLEYLYAYNATQEPGEERHIVLITRPGHPTEERKVSTLDLAVLLLTLEVEWKTA